jgi:hypothetical protein
MTRRKTEKGVVAVAVIGKASVCPAGELAVAPAVSAFTAAVRTSSAVQLPAAPVVEPSSAQE